jgi:hypothetical protein
MRLDRAALCPSTVTNPDRNLHIVPPGIGKASPSIQRIESETVEVLTPKQDSIPLAAILDKWSKQPWTNGLQVDRMEDMEKLEVRTRNSLYEITIIEGHSGEILVRGGQFFPALTPARLAGATLGGSFCKMRGIYAGFRMEINANGRRTVTTPVESIGILV